MDKEYAQKLKEATKEAEARYSIPAYVFALYSLVVTLFCFVENWRIVATIPQWFVNRWENIKFIAGFVRKAYLYLHDVIPVSWTEFARHGIPLAIFALILFFGLYVGLYKAVICSIWDWNKQTWESYRLCRETERKRAFTAFYGAISLMGAIIIVSLWRNPVNVLSWFLLFFVVAYVFYHRGK